MTRGDREAPVRAGVQPLGQRDRRQLAWPQAWRRLGSLRRPGHLQLADAGGRAAGRPGEVDADVAGVDRVLERPVGAGGRRRQPSVAR
jgi:hypothetical protein